MISPSLSRNGAKFFHSALSSRPTVLPSRLSTDGASLLAPFGSSATGLTTFVKAIDTSPEPDEAFHRLSIADAVASGKPSVVAFATPSFCETRTCGPSLEVVTEAAKTFEGKVNFVHVEPYKLDSDGVLKLGPGNQRQLAEAGIAWGLPSEPWVFVVDAGGTVVARFEGPYTLEELLAVLQGVTG